MLGEENYGCLTYPKILPMKASSEGQNRGIRHFRSSILIPTLWTNSVKLPPAICGSSTEPAKLMLGFHIFTLFLDTPSTFPHLHATNVLKTHKPNAISAFKLQISTANNVVNSLWFPLGNYCQPIQSTLTAPQPFFFCSLGNSAIGFTSQRL